MNRANIIRLSLDISKLISLKEEVLSLVEKKMKYRNSLEEEINNVFNREIDKTINGWMRKENLLSKGGEE